PARQIPSRAVRPVSRRPRFSPPGPFVFHEVEVLMTLFRTIAPSVEPVTLNEAKQMLRIAHDSEDTLLSGLVRAAREEVEASCGLALLDQRWRLALDVLPPLGRVLLRRHPVREISSITFYGEDGEGMLVPPDSYR